MSALSQNVKDEMCRYFRHLAGRVEKAARSLPAEKLWVNPFGYGNDMGHLLLHLTGNLNHYIGAGIAKTGYVRNRPLEFTDPNRYPGPELLAKFRAAVELVCTTIQGMGDDAFQAPVEGQPPVQTNFGLLLVCVAHLNNHIGQMSWLVKALGHDTNEPPVW